MAKLKYEDIKKEVEDAGWQLLTEKYTNLKTDMIFKCPNGHNNYYSLEKWKRNHKCLTCENNPFANVPTSPIKKKGYRILAFDQASITSGFSVFDNGDLITYGKWSSNGNRSIERITQTKAWVACMIDKWKPDLVIFEDIQYQKNLDSSGEDGALGQMGVTTFKKLAALQGVLKNYCFENGIIYKIVPSVTWRAHSEIKGKARTDRKKNAQLKVKRFYDIEVDNDIADAILIGRWAVFDHSQSQMINFE